MLSKDEERGDLEFKRGQTERAMAALKACETTPSRAYLELQETLRILDLALVGLSVQEGVKDAREVAIQIYNECIDDSQPHIELFDEEKAAHLIAAFALKQRGEVIAGFDSHGCIVSKGLVAFKCDPGASWLLDTWAENNKNAKVHVAITALDDVGEGAKA